MSSSKPRLRYLLFYVTSRCNLRCRHCFYLDELNQHDELSLDEIKRVAASLRPLAFVRMTGGEPFLRDDLPEVTEAFHRIAGVRRMGIITNGTKTDKIKNSVDGIFERCPSLSLDVGVSIDGLEETHDAIRGLRGAYEKARRTVEIVTQAKERYPNLLVSLVITLTAKNEPELDALFEELSGWGVDRISVNHARGLPEDSALMDVSLERYLEFAKQCEEYHLSRDRSWKANLQRAKNRLTREAISQVAQGGKSSIPCLAGSAIGVLYSDGAVHLCETLEKPLKATGSIPETHPQLGNVRDVDYNFNRLWHSQQADHCRQWIQAVNCSCTHECFLTASILFGKKNYFKLIREWLKLTITG